MATSLVIWDAKAANLPTSAAARFFILGTTFIPVIAFDASAAQTAYYDAVVPQGATGTHTLVIKGIMATATSGKVDIEVQVEAITPGDAVALHTTTSFDTANGITAPTVPGTLGYMFEITCTLTNMDSYAAGDWIRFAVKRDATDGTNDTASGDYYLISVEWRI